MSKTINNQTHGTPLVDKEGRPTVEFFTLIEALVGYEMLDGLGSPEGVVKAKFKVWYIDTVTDDIYIKTTNESVNTGWVLK